MFPPASGPLGVNVAEQLRRPAGARQRARAGAVKASRAAGNRPTVPVGVVGDPLETSSVTVAVHVEGCSIFTVPGEQLTLVEVGCPTTVTV